VTEMDAQNLFKVAPGPTAIAPLQKSAATEIGPAADKIARQKAAQEFASLFFLEVLKAMRATSLQDQTAETDTLSRDIYGSMMDTEVSRLMAKQDAGGLTKVVEKALDRFSPQGGSRSGSSTSSDLEKKEMLADKMNPPSPDIVAGRMPVDGKVSSNFGMRHDPIDGLKKFHEGIDIAARSGTPVTAVDGGIVTFSGRKDGYGNLVEILHGSGFVTRYAHNANNLVSVGEEVKPGQKIAFVGNLGRSTGPHLHFEVRRDGKPIDPTVMLNDLAKSKKLSLSI